MQADFPYDLIQFQGAPAAFWQAWTQAAAQYVGAELAVLSVRAPTRMPADGWSVLASWPPVRRQDTLPGLTTSVGEDLIAAALQNGIGAGDCLVGPGKAGLVRVRPVTAERELMLCLYFPASSPSGPSPDTMRMLATIPLAYEQFRQQRIKEREAARFAEALEMLGRILESENFDQAALALVNGVAERFGCEQVALCWMAGEGLKLRGLSHSDKLGRRTEFSDLLEEVGQEALIQGQEIVWPGQGKAVSRAHQVYAEARQPGHMLTLPLLLDEVPLGAVVCERQGLAFSQSELWALRLFCDQATRPLRDFEDRRKFLPKRLWREIRASLPRQLRPITSEGRRFAAALGIGILAILQIPLSYRVEANFVLKTDAMAQISAPFDGYIESSHVSLGAPVEADSVVVSLATRELLLERAASLADITQFSLEIEKHRAANQLSEMRIAEAKLAQTQAKLKQVEYRLAHAEITTPLAGVVVEGEPGKNLGGPVKRGDMLIKVASIENLHAEIAVTERDIHLVVPGQTMEIKLVASPDQAWEMRVRRITPAPDVRDGHNAFPVRAEAEAGYPSWWRPGMSGVAKIRVGKRTIFWMATHRILDFLRLKLWI